MASKSPKYVVASNDLSDVAEQIEEWDASADLCITLVSTSRAKAMGSATGSAAGSNVDFVVYEMREVFRAKRGF